jgi:hypothetical protein
VSISLLRRLRFTRSESQSTTSTRVFASILLDSDPFTALIEGTNSEEKELPTAELLSHTTIVLS